MADLDVESAPGFTPDGVGVIDGPKISCLDARLRNVLRDGYAVELLVATRGTCGSLLVVANGN